MIQGTPKKTFFSFRDVAAAKNNDFFAHRTASGRSIRVRYIPPSDSEPAGGPRPPGVARDSYFLFFFHGLNLLIEFSFLLAFLKDARERGAHDGRVQRARGRL
jgi:hypothetical protein